MANKSLKTIDYNVAKKHLSAEVKEQLKVKKDALIKNKTVKK